MATKTRTTVYFDDKVLNKIKAAAEELGMSVSAFLTMLANNYKASK